jgi:hypothetical protein
MKIRVWLAAALALLLSAEVPPTRAAQFTIDFNDLSAAGNPDVGPSITVDGFVFSSPHFNAIGQPAVCPFICIDHMKAQCPRMRSGQARQRAQRGDA